MAAELHAGNPSPATVALGNTEKKKEGLGCGGFARSVKGFGRPALLSELSMGQDAQNVRS